MIFVVLKYILVSMFYLYKLMITIVFSVYHQYFAIHDHQVILHKIELPVDRFLLTPYLTYPSLHKKMATYLTCP